ncbi:glycoside hydrolase family 15 protein [Streptomyces gobiensis]|uniref:glycoside hydrolase family 15 protein n=1 Tax=Streptomyces gobiensis TaxID=2875706 RepID=UPI001E63C4E5|nr:glycoside hydrolase family 15 protein [Streptomyces gobiensis]UGY94471.1 glycoside hydrolase family 15 protein [Streptomyces gobiensis]
MTAPRPLTAHQGYPPIEDHGLVGDGRGCALIGRDGSVGFMCVPRFDDPPLFCGLLDQRHGGELRLVPAGLRLSAQSYLKDTGVLVTQMHTDSGVVEVTDAFLLRSGARLQHDEPAAEGALVRRARVTHGDVDLRVVVRPREGVEHTPLRVRASRPLTGSETTVPLRQGEELHLILDWDGAAGPEPGPAADDRIEETLRIWRDWAAEVKNDLPRADLVRRSAITLKLLDHVENGAIVAAPTSSLPEHIGGSRNWDYRYSWIRDAAFSVFALRRLGLAYEAAGFLDWVLSATERHPIPRVLYDIAGEEPPPEVIDSKLSGYRGSVPVRWGNGAARQRQHDVFGEILDCAFQWAALGGEIRPALWERLTALAEQARTLWDRPDHGIWEVRAKAQPFTYSVAMCQVALDRAARLARRLQLPGDPEGWAAQAERIRDRILRDAWNERSGALGGQLGGRGALDASVLALPLRRVVAADHPRMVASADAIAKQLDAGGGLLYRYLPEETADGIGEPEGAFVLCSFWLVDNLVGQCRMDEAGELFERVCSYASPLGLLSEQIDPVNGSMLGNFPQGLSHVGLISSAETIARVEQGKRPELSTQSWFED